MATVPATASPQSRSIHLSFTELFFCFMVTLR
jgi:hypothetical protein